MKILAVDTSSFPASAAVAEDNVILGEYVIRNKKKHSQNLMVMVERLLNDLDMDISEMDMFAVTVGPGSFTGLRIGISTVRAFAQAAGKPVVGINTLEALAYNYVGSSAVVIPMLDARREEVFTAAYCFSGNEQRELLAPTVMTVDEISELFSDGIVIYTGDGMLKHREEITGEDVIFAPANLSEVRAASVAALALAKADTAVHYNMITPLYLRKSQAERELENKKKGLSDK
ncbi:MAG: tRNA (adenosine(37)-N6)-threonylcarbamoyltransferase complex dimerization subunit type 1 TsaB [Oscillospiraceae bacterium]|nr:tRNA (adenosine(37)-N6)-threonylcarbamoyltransferase complex dimerization subunit type 1 TsaB [Oscillospiraceae bacterium]